MPKPEEDLETSESSCESYNVGEDEDSEELSSEEETESASTAETAPSTLDKVSSNQTVVLGEGIRQISESSYQTALASTSFTGPDDVANAVDGYDNIEDDMQQYVNANCSGKWRFNSKFLGKIQIGVSEGKYKRRSVVLTVLSKISKM